MYIGVYLFRECFHESVCVRAREREREREREDCSVTACFPVSYHSSSTYTRLPVGGGVNFLSIRVGELGKGKTNNEGAARK